MPKSLYVGNLPWQVKEDEIAQKFSEAADIIATRLIADKITGKSRGFAFVEVADEDAEKVVKAMNGYNWAGREIIVNEARPKKERTRHSRHDNL